MRPGRALDFAYHLAEIEFGHNECFCFQGQLLNALLRKWPASDEAQLADFQTLCAGEFDAALRNA